MEAAAGLGALGFWIFLPSIVVAGIWFDARKRESQQETLRRVVESGQQLDAAVIDKMLVASSGNSRPDRDLKVSGIIMFFIALGLPVFGWFLSGLNERLFGVMLGIGLLVFFIGLGLFIAGKVTQRWYQEDKG